MIHRREMSGHDAKKYKLCKIPCNPWYLEIFTELKHENFQQKEAFRSMYYTLYLLNFSLCTHLLSLWTTFFEQFLVQLTNGDENGHRHIFWKRAVSCGN